MRHYPLKRFGQNFLEDKGIINTILRIFAPKPQDNIVEIGPGLGALTSPLLACLPHLTAIEIDTNLQEYLATLPLSHKLTLIKGDALTINYASLGEQLRLIGNLPYNISTPLLLHVLQDAAHIEDMHFMLQKEVVDRLAAVPGNKSYGRLSVVVQYRCEVTSLLNVPASAFNPPPKVESAVVRLVPYHEPPYPSVDENQLRQVVKTAFAMRRKTLANNFKSVLMPQDWLKLDIDAKQRPEQLSVSDYVRITKFLAD